MALSSLGLGIITLRGFRAARTPPGPRGRAGMNPSRPSVSDLEVSWS
jgi:hypothetical protein